MDVVPQGPSCQVRHLIPRTDLASRASFGNSNLYTLQEGAFICKPDRDQSTPLQRPLLPQNLLTERVCSTSDRGKCWARYFEFTTCFTEIVAPRTAIEKECSGPLLAKRALRPNAQQHENDCALYRCIRASVEISSATSPRRHFICG